MSENKARTVRRESFLERLIRRLLESIGGVVDTIFGRGKKRDALPSTGDLAERLRRQIDKQCQINKDGRKLAPHLISLKYAWGQSSDEFLAALKQLKNELLVVAIDYINDNRYTTLAPVKINSKADILTTGFTMSIGFDEESLANAEQVEIPVEIYAKLLPPDQQPTAPHENKIEVNTITTFPNGNIRERVLYFIPDGISNLTVGRTKENDLFLDEASVSRHHASLVMTADGKMRVADIGSSNGTFLNGERIAYGKAFEIEREMTVSFGDVEMQMAWDIPAPKPEPIIESETEEAAPQNESLEGNDAEIKIKVGSSEQEANESQANNESETHLNAIIEPETFVKTNGEPETAIKSNDEPETGSNVEIEVAKNVPSEIENAIKSNEESETVIGKGMLREESSTDFTSSLKN